MLNLSLRQRETLALMGVDVWVERSRQAADVSLNESFPQDTAHNGSVEIIQSTSEHEACELLVVCDGEAGRLRSADAAERRLLSNILFACGAGSLDQPAQGIVLAAVTTEGAGLEESIESLLARADRGAVMVFGERARAAVQGAKSVSVRVTAPSLSRVLVDPTLKPAIWRQIVAWKSDR